MPGSLAVGLTVGLGLRLLPPLQIVRHYANGLDGGIRSGRESQRGSSRFSPPPPASSDEVRCLLSKPVDFDLLPRRRAPLLTNKQPPLLPNVRQPSGSLDGE
jgi:hypothetical protein